MPWIEHTNPNEQKLMLNPGKYFAKALRASVGEVKSGAWMVWIQIQIGEETFRAGQCLILKDGTVSEITLRTLREIFGWDGVNAEWLLDEGNIAGRDCEAVLDWEEFTGRDGKQKKVLKVKYLNPPGGGRDLPEPGDLKKLQAKFGAKLRAMSGGTPASRPVKSVPAVKVEKPAKPSVPTPSVPAEKQDDGQDNGDQAWAECSEFHGADAEVEWFKLLEKFVPNKEISEITPQEWRKIRDNIRVAF